MRWYWWVLIGFLAINALAIVMIGLFMLMSHIRSRRRLHGGGPGESKEDIRGSGR